jgi:molybdate transport repressor ModE-like protein
MIDFLEKAYETGSMAKATKAVGISYAKGRKMLGTLNNLANRKLVITHAGGTNGGETRLALEGKVFLEVVSENETVVFAPNHL